MQAFTCLLFFINIQFVGAQIDSLIQLNEIVVEGKSEKHNLIAESAQRIPLDGVAALGVTNLAGLLQSASNVFIKSYGSNSLASSSIRGGSAGHTLVLWNDLPIYNGMHGLTDLALIPNNLAEEIYVTQGGNSSLWGSGAIGGTIHLNNSLPENNEHLYSSETLGGQYGRFKQSFLFSQGNEKIKSVTKLNYQHARNDFPIKRAVGFPIELQTNASFNQQDLIQSLYYYPKANREIYLHFWKQLSFREIPPTLTQSFSKSNQEDDHTRVITGLKLYNKNSITNFKFAFFDEQIEYQDELIGLVSPSHFQSFIIDLTWKYAIDIHQQILIESINTLNTATSDYYIQKEKEYKTGVFVSHKFRTNRLSIQTGLRKEYTTFQHSPFTPSLSIQYHLDKGFLMSAKVNRNFRLPTMNDRYWRPGGNIDLKPEEGWSQEMGLKWIKKDRVLDLEMSATVFNRSISNWILWSRLEEQSFWSPSNVAEVWSRGVNVAGHYALKTRKADIKIGGQYDYTKSTNQVELQNPRLKKGSQLAYTPLHQGSIFGSIKFKQGGINYSHQWIGRTTGINHDVPAYNIGNLTLECRPWKKRENIKVFSKINNIWNHDYYVIERRPMMKRNIEFGLAWKLIKTNNR